MSQEQSKNKDQYSINIDGIEEEDEKKVQFLSPSSQLKVDGYNTQKTIDSPQNQKETVQSQALLYLPQNQEDENEDEDLKEEKYSEETKSKILFSCLFALFVASLITQNVSAFLPNYIDDNHQFFYPQNDTLIPNEIDGKKVDPIGSSQVAIIICIFSVAQMIFSPFVSSMKNRLGGKNAIILGFFMMVATSAGLGLISLIGYPINFLCAGVITRFLQGAGFVLLQVTCYSIVTSVFKEDMEKYVTLVEVASMLGEGLGPYLGSAVQPYLGYANTMYLFGIINAIGMIVCIIVIPSVLNKKVSHEKIEEMLVEMEKIEEMNQDSQVKNKKITFKTLLFNRHSFFAIILCFVGSTYSTFFEAFLSVTLKVRGMNPDYVGYVFGTDCFVFGLCSVIYSYTCINYPRKIVFVMGLFLAGMTFLMMGPSLLFDFPNENYLTIGSFFPLGVIQMFVFLPIIPEMIQRLQVEYGISELDEKQFMELNDRVNDAYGFLQAFGSCVAPFIGGYLQEKQDDANHVTLAIGSRKVCDQWAMMNFGLAFIFFIFNCGPMFISENREFKKKLNAIFTESESKYDVDFVQNVRSLSVMKSQSKFIKFSRGNIIDYKQVRQDMKLRRIRNDYLELKKDIQNAQSLRKTNTVFYKESVLIKKQTFKAKQKWKDLANLRSSTAYAKNEL